MSRYSPSSVRIRLEKPDDVAGIRRANELAFEGCAEADLVDALRAAGAIILSMVAVIDPEASHDEEAYDAGAVAPTWDGGATLNDIATGGEVVGHALFTPVTVVTGRGEVPLVGLGPVAVLPEQQSQGIGTMLIESCLEHLRKDDRAGVVVLGHPGYYPRFGFIPAVRWGLRWEEDAPEEAFMALELSPGRLGGISGVVRYRPEFLGMAREA